MADNARAEGDGSVKPLSERPRDQWCDRHHRYGCCPAPSTLPRAGWTSDEATGTLHNMSAPKPPRGWPEHRYIYSTEDGDSCSCGWTPPHFRTDPDEWDAHLDAAGVPPKEQP